MLAIIQAYSLPENAHFRSFLIPPNYLRSCSKQNASRSPRNKWKQWLSGDSGPHSKECKQKTTETKCSEKIRKSLGESEIKNDKQCSESRLPNDTWPRRPPSAPISGGKITSLKVRNEEEVSEKGCPAAVPIRNS